MLLVLSLMVSVQAGEGYLRRPDLHGEQLVFSAEGDLWLAPAAGGMARRLTSHVGDERSAHFSPDGQWIAFTGEYDGNMDAFVIPVEGGEPQRLTWHPGPDDVVDWTPDGRVIFRSPRTDPNNVVRLYTVPRTGGDATELPLGWASRLGIDPKTGLYAFTRLGREEATWKRYRGGSADDIWVGDPKKADFHQVTSFDGPDSFPMWHDGRIYFLSDYGGTANLWSMAPDGSDRIAATQFQNGWDVRYPSIAPDGRIAFMLAGDLHIYNPATKSSAKVDIQLPGERSLSRVRYSDAGSWLSDFSLSTDGDRVIVTARGEVFSLPTEPGVAIPVTSTSGARESSAAISPDGKQVCYITDASGEEAIVTADAWGRGEAKTVVPAGTLGWHFPPKWSADGKYLAYSDETHTLYIVLADGSAAPKAIDSATQAEITDYEWSPNGRYLAYSKTDSRNMNTLFVYDTVAGDIHRIGGANVENYSPSWDPDGRYLYFLSSRITNPIGGMRDYQKVLLPEILPFAVLLKADTPNPFADNKGLPPAPENPQATAEKKKKKKKKEDKKKEQELLEPTELPLPAVAIEWDGIDQRVVAFPRPPSFYVGIGATSDRVFLAERAVQGANEPRAQGTNLMAFDLESKDLSFFAGGVTAFSLAPKAKKIALAKDGELYVVGSGGSPNFSEARIPLEDATIELDPREEWKQIFREAWRHERDFFWDENMSGIDWKAIHDQYATLLPRLATRSDLTDLIGEMIGELGTSHTYIWGGERGVRVPWVSGGLLGAELTREGGAFKIARIYRGDPADNVESPLSEPGAGIREGDYILAVDRQPVQGSGPIEALLAGRAGRRVLLTVNKIPSLQGAREVAITPAFDDYRLRYVDWVRRNREYVESKSGGKLGYIHIPDMGTPGMVAFETWLYPQADKEGLVIDVRWNRGGNVSQLILDRLRRPILGWDLARHGGVDPYPYARRRGPFVVITNGFAGSDGDIFPQAVQVEKLAPVLGERSWGGVVGIRNDKPMVDGGILTQPEYAFYFNKDGWGVENRGVVPDLIVPWDPADAAAGRDTQLDAAIAETLRLREQNPPPTPPTDRTNDKSRKAYEGREK